MVRIIRYEVYADKGAGWRLLDQFSADDRQEATFCAKEAEERGCSVKIVREIYETNDGSFHESVEYIGGLKNKKKIKSVEDAVFDDLKGEYNVEATPFKVLASNQVSKAIFKLVLIVFFSLILANLLTSLALPLIEFIVPDEKRKGVLFCCFFTIFVMFAAPLLFYKVPWDVFYSLRKGEKELINERRIFRRATSLMKGYTLNDDGTEVITPSFPDAPLEYKEYIIDYLSQVLNNLDPQIKLNDGFNRLGVELIVYGGCLELSRYGRLVWAEANSLLYEAFKILEGSHVDLQAFYDAKRTYVDSKIAVFLTGVGSYLMSQIINGAPMDVAVLKMTMEKWIASNTHPETNVDISIVAPEGEEKGLNIAFECLVNIRLIINIYDDEKFIGQDEQEAVQSDIRLFMSRLIAQCGGDNVIENGNLTTIHFSNLGKAIQFIDAFNKELFDYKDNQCSYNLMVDERIALLDMLADNTVNLSRYIEEVLKYSCAQDVIVDEAIKNKLEKVSYSFESLGDKTLRKSDRVVSLYKMSGFSD